MRSQLAKVSHLSGLAITAASGNKARVEIIGPGGVRVAWKNEPTEADRDDAVKFITSRIEANVAVTTAGAMVDLDIEAEQYREWLNRDE